MTTLPRSRALFGALALLATLLLRWPALRSTPWHPDEGMVAEAATRLAHGQPYAVGAIRQTAFFPLSCSPLAPLAAAVAVKLSPASAMLALREWSVLLSGLTAACLLWFLWPLDRSGALLSAAVFALSPLARDLQAMGYYHHLGALFAALSLGLLLQYGRKPTAWAAWRLALACGLAVAAAYWLLWLLILPPIAAWAQGRRREAWQSAILALLPLLIVLAWSYLNDAVGFRGDIIELLSQTQADLPGHLNRIRGLLGYWVAARANPALFMAPVLWALWMAALGPGRWRSTAAWLGLWALLCSLEAFRQRQNMDAFAYPLILVLPGMAVLLGMAGSALLKRAWSGHRAQFPWVLLLLAAAGGSLRARSDFSLLRMASEPPALAADLFANLPRWAQAGDTVLAEPALNWALCGQGLKASDLEQASAFSGERSAFLRADLPRDRFNFDLSLAQCKLLIVSPFTYGVSLNYPGTRRLALDAERFGWSKLWDNGRYQVYGNPAFGFKRPVYAERILNYYNLYDEAAQEAFDRGDLDAARFAVGQALAYIQGDRAGRLALLAKINAASERR